MPTRDYRDKRTLDETPEPGPDVSGNVDPGTAPPGPSFVIHQHHARRLHFDLRLEMMNGDVPVLVSWAVPKGLPLRPGKAHLAVHVEDHPFEYGSFSGAIPAGNYGAGEVRIFDSGTYEVLEQEVGKLTFRLKGDRLQGVWHLFRTRSDEGKDDWLVRLRALERPDPEPMPPLKPMMATLVREPFDDERWIFEPKWDGVRALAVCGEETKIISRTGRDVTYCYPEVARLHERLVAIDAIVDGEIIATVEGRPSFELLQSRINLHNPRDIEKAAKATPVTFIAFDVIYLDGRSLTDETLQERKDILEELVVPSPSLQVSTYIPGSGTALFDAAKSQHLEGIVAKKLGTAYRPGKRTRDWLKIKATFEVDVVVGGWSPGEGGRSSSFGALLVGAYDDEGLKFMGAVGTGFDDKTLEQVKAALKELESEDCPFTMDPTGTKSNPFGRVLHNPHWVTPKLVARVEFRELTSAGRLRAPSFKGLVHDREPEDCQFSEIQEMAGGGAE
jgi:bifunctional non-homologous end joining protein LigD